MPQSSRIFIRNRAIGYVSNHIPAVTRYIKHRKDNVIVTCVGKSFHTYSKDHLKLLAVSDASEDEISCLAADSRQTYTASGSKVQGWIRGTTLYKTYPGHKEPVNLILPFGAHLISVDEDNVLRVWERGDEELFLELNFDSASFRISAISHPSTYINKILLGSVQGSLQLWNIKTSKLVYAFEGWKSSVTCLEQSPAIDVTAIGLQNGKIILHNLKYDKTVMEFCQDWGPVLCLSFRTDGPPVMASGSTVGHIVLWDLEEKRVYTQILDAHCGPVSTARFLPNEPLLISSSQDNSLKMWIFDKTDNSGRLLRQREGHAAQPTFIRFHGGNGYYIMSAGTDSSLRVFSLVNETYNYSMGKASFNRKAAKKKKVYAEKLLMPPIVEFTSETTRDKEWDSIAAVHSGLPMVTTWSFDRRKMGDLRLIPEKFSRETRASLNVIATCVALTSCGNFALVGYSSGHVERFNVQSGIHRCQYGEPSAHKRSVRGVLPDPLNQIVLSADSVGNIKFWAFKPDKSTTICNRILGKLKVDQGVTFIRSQRDSSLVALAFEDFSIGLIDFTSRKLARRLSGHSGHITDLTFSPDCRWIISASADSSIRVWDLPTASLIDMFKVDSICTSLALSPSGHMLATIHVDNLGIYLWYNKSLYSTLNLKPMDPTGKVPHLGLPSSRGSEGPVPVDEETEEFDDESGHTDDSPEQIENCITLSGLPSARWLNLLDIEIIRKRNKAKAKINVPEKAPFFLPTIPSSRDVLFDLSKEPEISNSVRNLRLESIHSRTSFATSLEKSSSEDDYFEIVEKLKSMSPSLIDLELNSIGFDPLNSEKLISKFIKIIEYMLVSNKNFELAQSYLSLLLKLHGTTIASSSVLKEQLIHVEKKQKESWDSIQSDLMYLLSVIEGFNL